MYTYYYYIIYYIEYIHILRTVETCAPNHRKRPKFEFKILKQLNKLINLPNNELISWIGEIEYGPCMLPPLGSMKSFWKRNISCLNTWKQSTICRVKRHSRMVKFLCVWWNYNFVNKLMITCAVLFTIYIYIWHTFSIWLIYL